MSEELQGGRLSCAREPLGGQMRALVAKCPGPRPPSPPTAAPAPTAANRGARAHKKIWDRAQG